MPVHNAYLDMDSPGNDRETYMTLGNYSLGCHVWERVPVTTDSQQTIPKLSGVKHPLIILMSEDFGPGRVGMARLSSMMSGASA